MPPLLVSILSPRRYSTPPESFLQTTDLPPPAPTDPHGSLPFKLNLAATVLVPAIVPFTLAFILPTNHKLIAKKDEFASLSQKSTRAKAGMPGGWEDIDVEGGETVHALIDRWAMLNLARAVLVAGGAFCTVLAALC